MCLFHIHDYMRNYTVVILFLIDISLLLYEVSHNISVYILRFSTLNCHK